MSDTIIRKHRFPILLKTAIIIFVVSFVIVEIAMTYYSLVISNRNKETYNTYADALSSSISNVVDVKDYNTMMSKVNAILNTIPEEERILSDNEDETKLDEYIAHYDSLYEDDDFMASFNKVREGLRKVVTSNSKMNVDCAYLAYVYPYTDASGVKQGLFVYLCDSAPDEDACPPGWLDPLYDFNKEVIDNPSRGFPAYTTDTSYGYLITSGSQIDGATRGYAFVDISMDAVRRDQADSIIRLFVYLIVTINLLAVTVLVLIYFIFTRPLKRLTNTARSFDNTDPDYTHQKFLDLKVNTHDEIQELAETLKVMEENVYDRINQLVEVNEALLTSEKQTAKMTALAKRDSMTGVGSKTAYDIEVEQIDESIKNKEDITFGIVMIDLNNLKPTNDDYGHIAGDKAIIRLSHTISLVFKNSEVYRVGGDEFVVIVRDEECHNIKALVKEFKERINDIASSKKLQRYERITAAIGYSLYTKEDKSVDDVFRRADQEMYQCKRMMKNQQDKKWAIWLTFY